MSQAAVALPSSELVAERYRPLRPLGSGGSGSVWLARDERTGLDVALKIVPREGKAATRAEREALAAARLRHERCLRAYAFERDTRNVYIAYEYVPGQTMRQALRAGELTDATSVEAAAQVLEALAHAHAQGVVHRDVKPSNVLVAEEEEMSVRLLDFGLAQLTEEEPLTASGDVPGTLAYVPPERLHGEPGEPAADVWAVGVMLWEALAGFHPFWNGSLLETARWIDEGAAPLAHLRPDLPKPLCALVDRMLSLDPAARPPAALLAHELRDALAERIRRKTKGPGISVALPLRLAGPAAAGLFAGWTAAALPFYPGAAGPLLGVLAFALAFVRPRLGLAFALAVPVFPLGNISSGLAFAYGAVALVWLALSWRAPQDGLFVVAGPLLGPIHALGLLPLASQGIRSLPRRALQVAAAVLLAALVAGLRHSSLPFTGAAPPKGLGIAGSQDPLAVVYALGRGLTDRPVLLLEALVLAAAAVAIPFARARGLWGIAVLGAAMIALTLLPAPSVAAVPLVVAAWVTCIVLALKARS